MVPNWDLGKGIESSTFDKIKFQAILILFAPLAFSQHRGRRLICSSRNDFEVVVFFDAAENILVETFDTNKLKKKFNF